MRWFSYTASALKKNVWNYGTHLKFRHKKSQMLNLNETTTQCQVATIWRQDWQSNPTSLPKYIQEQLSPWIRSRTRGLDQAEPPVNRSLLVKLGTVRKCYVWMRCSKSNYQCQHTMTVQPAGGYVHICSKLAHFISSPNRVLSKIWRVEKVRAATNFVWILFLTNRDVTNTNKFSVTVCHKSLATC